MERRIITTEATEEDVRIETTLRPQCLSDYVGQEKIKSTLKIYIEAAKSRGEALDHVLFYGPPGLGKTTLSGIIANEMGSRLKVTSGPAIEKPGEMAAILNNLQEGDVLFVDEIHRLNRQVEEVLYPAMEDFAIDIMLGKESSARSIRLELPHFTLVGATTRAGLLSAPLRDRFGVVQRMEFYTPEELRTIIQHSATILGVEIEPEGAIELAKRSRGTPRLANRLLKRVRDFAQVKYDGVITKEVADFALDIMDVDKMGLDQNDRNILLMIIEKFSGGPVGLDTLAAALGEDAGTLEDVYEPYLLMNGLINRTPRGRMATDRRWKIRMDTKNYTQVLIDGKIYTLGGSEDEAYLQKAASYVNEKITTMHALPGFSKQSADYQQLMLLLNIADDYFKTKETADQMEEQRDRMEKETYSLKHELVSTQMKLDGVLKDLEERQRQLQELSAKLSKSERELRAAKKQAALAATSENGEEEVVEDEVVDTVIEGDEPVSESVPALDETAAAQATESGFVQADMPMQNPSFQTKTGLSDQELARKALQAARKAGSHRNGRR